LANPHNSSPFSKWTFLLSALNSSAGSIPFFLFKASRMHARKFSPLETGMCPTTW
jgi:hypothetical protein